MKKPFFSIIIPTKKINNLFLTENLPSFKNQTFKNFEVIILSDNDNHLIDLLIKYPWIKIISSKKKGPAQKRNFGVKKASGKIIAFIDDDAYPKKDWLESAKKIICDKKLVSICGPGRLPIKTNFWEKVFDECLKSFLGSGYYTYRFTVKNDRFVDDYPLMNFFIKKEVFDKVGGFITDYWPGEDSKFCENLVYKEKKKIFYSSKVVVYHHRRNSLLGFFKQHANYGFHRGSFFAHGDRNSLKLSYLLPTFFFLYFVFLITYQPSLLLFYFPLFVYLFFGLIQAVQSFFNTKNLFIFILVFPVIFLMHITYGIMFIIGLIKNKNEK